MNSRPDLKDVTELFEKVASFLIAYHGDILGVIQTRQLENVARGVTRVDWGDLSHLTVTFENEWVDSLISLDIRVDSDFKDYKDYKLPYITASGEERYDSKVNVRVKFQSSGSCTVSEADAILAFYTKTMHVCNAVERIVNGNAPNGVSYVRRTAEEVQEAEAAALRGRLAAFAEKYGKGMRVGQARAIELNRLPPEVPVGSQDNVFVRDNEYKVEVTGVEVGITRVA